MYTVPKTSRVPMTSSKQNKKSVGFMTQTQVNSVLRDLVTPKDTMRSTYKRDRDSTFSTISPRKTLNNKPVVIVPSDDVKTNYHKSQINFKDSMKKSKLNSYKSLGALNQNTARNTFTELGFKQTNKGISYGGMV